jgi:hypothetical protein
LNAHRQPKQAGVRTGRHKKGFDFEGDKVSHFQEAFRDQLKFRNVYFYGGRKIRDMEKNPGSKGENQPLNNSTHKSHIYDAESGPQ